MEQFYDPEKDEQPEDGQHIARGNYAVNYANRGFKHAQELIEKGHKAEMLHGIIWASDGIPFTENESITVGATKIFGPKFAPKLLRQYLFGFAEGIRQALTNDVQEGNKLGHKQAEEISEAFEQGQTKTNEEVGSMVKMDGRVEKLVTS